jgi:hypothetical protein
MKQFRHTVQQEDQEALVRRLAAALEREPGVASAYLYGSVLLREPMNKSGVVMVTELSARLTALVEVPGTSAY